MWNFKIPRLSKQSIMFFLLELSSGLTFLLTLTTLIAWLMEAMVTDL
jgi:hypothetical protein